MEEARIASDVETKNPKKVEGGKRLGAVSRQAKVAKAKRLADSNSTDQWSEYVDIENIDPLTAVGIVGVIGGVAYYGYLCYMSKCKKNRESGLSEGLSENPKDSPKNSEDSPKERKGREYRQLDTLG